MKTHALAPGTHCLSMQAFITSSNLHMVPNLPFLQLTTATQLAPPLTPFLQIFPPPMQSNADILALRTVSLKRITALCGSMSPLIWLWVTILQIFIGSRYLISSPLTQLSVGPTSEESTPSSTTTGYLLKSSPYERQLRLAMFLRQKPCIRTSPLLPPNFAQQLLFTCSRKRQANKSTHLACNCSVTPDSSGLTLSIGSLAARSRPL